MKCRSWMVAVLALAVSGLAHGRVGENIKQIKARMGEPGPQAKKGAVVWFFEEGDGRMVYSVTLNDKDISVAEGLKPIGGATLTQESAQDFILNQLAPFKGTGTTRGVKPGEKYDFAGKSFTCGDNEVIMVNDEAGILIVWTRGRDPNIMAVSREMAKRL